MRYKILKSLDEESEFVCFNYKKNTRSYHQSSLLKALYGNDKALMRFDSTETNISFNDPEQYEMLYEFNSIEEFKEHYPEEFV